MDSTLIGIILIFTGIVAGTIAFQVYRWALRRTAHTETLLDDILVRAIGKPVIILAYVMPAIIAFEYYIQLPPEYAWIFDSKYVTVFYILIATWVIATFLHNFINVYGHWLSAKGNVDDRLVDLFELGTKYIILFLALLAILEVLGIDITPLLAGAGIAGIAAALALQDTLSNFFGGVTIILDKPFKERDRVQIDRFVGDIVHVGPRSTRIVTPDAQMVTIPNSIVTKTSIVTYSAPDLKMRLKIPFSVAYGTDLERVKALVAEEVARASQKCPDVSLDPAPEVLTEELGDSGIRMSANVWIGSCVREPQVKDDIIGRVYRRFASEGISIPYQRLDITITPADSKE